jgi:hypothetical protein
MIMTQWKDHLVMRKYLILLTIQKQRIHKMKERDQFI